jgi:hypothetical protein
VDAEIVLAALGAVLTLFIFSYLLDDNPLYRLALHIFVGVSVAYLLIVVIRSVILPIVSPPDAADTDNQLLWMISLVGVVLGALLLIRGIRGLSWLSDIPVVVLLGVGVGVALAGAVLGTLLPQMDAATNPLIPEPPIFPEILQLVGQAVAVIGTATGLMVFTFIVRRPARGLANRVLAGGAGVGRWFVLIGFGAVYGGVLVAGLALFADRIQYLIEVLEKISGG